MIIDDNPYDNDIIIIIGLIICRICGPLFCDELSSANDFSMIEGIIIKFLKWLREFFEWEGDMDRNKNGGPVDSEPEQNLNFKNL